MTSQLTTVDLLEEPSDEGYQQLLQLAPEYCDRILLVVRHSIELTDTAKRVLKMLECALVSTSESSEWPGTKLLDSTASVNTYMLTQDTLAVVREACSRLFAWQQPNLPEDLCLVRPDGTPWLVTIAHEEDAYLCVTPNEALAISLASPALKLNVKPPTELSGSSANPR